MKVIIPLFLLISASATGVFVVKGRHSAPRQPPAVTQPSSAQPRPAAMPRLDKQQRAELFQRITQAQQAASALANRQTEAAPAEPPELSAAYIRSQIQTLMPLLKECYENALRDKPQLAGKLVVNFSIVAEPDIGGLVTDSTVDTAQSTIADEGMRECVQETMYGAQFPAPQDGGEVKVTYPFIFKSEDD